jgi:hypothetical protein
VCISEDAPSKKLVLPVTCLSTFYDLLLTLSTQPCTTHWKIANMCCVLESYIIELTLLEDGTNFYVSMSYSVSQPRNADHVPVPCPRLKVLEEKVQ